LRKKAHKPECLPPRHNDKSGTLGKMGSVAVFKKISAQSTLALFSAEFHKNTQGGFPLKWKTAFYDEKDIYLNKYF